MKKTLYWIDDTHDDGKPPSAAAKTRLESGLNVNLAIVQVNERKEFGDLLVQLNASKGKNVCGIIMDYQLTKVGDNGLRAVGSTWAAEVRSVAPSIPVIGISHEPEKKIPRFSLESFLAFYPRDILMGLKPPFADVSALLQGHEAAYEAFKQQGRRKISGAELMLGLIDPPADARQLILSSIPSKLGGLWDQETPHVASRWIWHELQGRPGYLFDDLAIATYLGLNRVGFKKISEHFDGALYSGAFSSDLRARWWVSSIRGIVEKLLGKPVLGPVSSDRTALLDALKVAKRSQKDCLAEAHSHPSSKLVPDCVAYSDDETEEGDRVQAMFSDTHCDPRDVNPPTGFESRRIFGPARSHE